MSLAMQIVFGTLILTICALVHVAAFALLLPVLEKTNARMAQMRAITRHAVLMSVGVAATVAAHTIQIWLWAWALMLAREAAAIADAIRVFFNISMSSLSNGRSG